MMSEKSNAFIDTDIIIKIGGFQGERLLDKILSSYKYNLFLHEYLVEEELVFNQYALEQLDCMIKSGSIKILKECDLSKQERIEYKSTLNLLAENMGVDLKKQRDHNAGEVKSMAMAFAKGFQYFISDDSGARVAAKKHLQNIDGSYLETIRIKDIIIHIKENNETLNINRKTAKKLYLYGTNPMLGRNEREKKKLEQIQDKMKKIFDDELWKVD